MAMNSKMRTKKILFILLVLSSLAACAKKSEDRAPRTADPAVGVAGGLPTCGPGQPAMGHIYENGTSNTSLTFEQRVKGLISATVDPQFFGSISGSEKEAQNGVTLEGHLRYDGTGNVLLNQSNIKITIYDSFVGQLDSDKKVVQAYPINFDVASAGTMNLQTKEFTLQFKDLYGEITLKGIINSANVTGTVSYQNSTNVTGGIPAANVLGAFSIAACGWIN